MHWIYVGFRGDGNFCERVYMFLYVWYTDWDKASVEYGAGGG